MALSAAAASLIAAGIGAASGTANVIANNSINAKTRQWNERMLEKQNQWSLDQWNMTNEYNSPANQVARMQEAGLNPLYYGLDGSSANAFESAQPLGWNPQAPNFNSFANVGDAIAEMPLKQKQVELVNKQIDKINSDIRNQDENTKGTALDNEFKEATMKTRVRAEELRTEISEEEKKNIVQKRALVAEEIRKTSNEADNEFEKKSLINAETRMRIASADEIITLLPYKKLNVEADTMAKKAAASAATWSAMKEQKFIELGGVESQINETKARIDKIVQDTKTSEAQEQAVKAKTALDEWKHSVQNGTVFNWIIESPDSNVIERELAAFFNGVFNVANMVTTSVGNIFPKL